MKFYLATRTGNKDKVKEIINILKEAGNEISHDWTTHKSIKPYEENKKMAKLYAQSDLQGVLDCDVFVLITSQEVGPGMSSELGAALALNLVTHKPKVYVVGEYRFKNLFYLHPAVKYKKTIQEVLKEI